MANGYFERGEVYWVRLDAGIGTEKGYGRPGVIISANFLNNSSDLVSVAFTTTKCHKAQGWNVRNDATDRTSWVQCNQVMSYDKSRLGSCIGKLNTEEMRQVDAALETVFDLGYVDDTAVKEKETEIAAQNILIKELREEIAELKKQIASHDDDVLSHRAELEMWQRLYEKALDQVCTMKLTGDIARKAPVTVVEEAPRKMVEPQPVVEDEPKLLDINTAKFDDFRKIGLDSNLILTIINKRPYKSITDLKGLPGMTAIKFNLIEKKICCVQPKKIKSALVEPDVGYEQTTEKVNINTATGRELMEKLGINECYAYSITSHRNKHGLYTSLEELKNVKKIPLNFYDRYKDRLTLGEVVVPEQTSDKVNVNKATAEEICKKTGISLTTAKRIIQYRNKNGLYSSVEDLLKVSRFGTGCMEKYGGMFEV